MQLIHCSSSPPSKVHGEVIVVAYCSGYISSHSSANCHLMQFISVHSRVYHVFMYVYMCMLLAVMSELSATKAIPNCMQQLMD